MPKEAANNIEEQINNANGVGQKWEELSDSEKRWSNFDRYINENVGPDNNKKAGIPGLSDEDQAEFKKITAKNYIDEYKNAKGIQVDRIMGKLLSGKGTAQDFRNLYIGVAALSSKFEQTTLENKYLDPITDFCKKVAPISQSAADYSVIKEDFLNGCKCKFDENGYVVLNDAQKAELFNHKKNFDAQLKDIDKKLLADGYQKFRDTEYRLQSTNGVNMGLPESGSVDKTNTIASMTKGFLKTHPEFKAKTGEDLNAERENQKKALLTDMRNAGESIKTLKASWNAMKSHTAFSFFNSSEYNKMDKAYNAYIKAYDNLMAGKTIDGKSKRDNPDSIEPADIAKLRELQTSMQTAAKDYTEAKRIQKGGGIENHSTGQGKDRLAMADALSNFDLISKENTKAAERMYNVWKGKKTEKNTRVVTLSDLEGSERGRVNLDHHKRNLQRQSTAQKKNQAGKTM